jgi:hypothetical protein
MCVKSIGDIFVDQFSGYIFRAGYRLNEIDWGIIEGLLKRGIN